MEAFSHTQRVVNVRWLICSLTWWGILSWFICIANHHLVHFKYLTAFLVSCTSITLKEKVLIKVIFVYHSSIAFTLSAIKTTTTTTKQTGNDILMEKWKRNSMRWSEIRMLVLRAGGRDRGRRGRQREATLHRDGTWWERR